MPSSPGTFKNQPAHRRETAVPALHLGGALRVVPRLFFFLKRGRSVTGVRALTGIIMPLVIAAMAAVGGFRSAGFQGSLRTEMPEVATCLRDLEADHAAGRGPQIAACRKLVLCAGRSTCTGVQGSTGSGICTLPRSVLCSPDAAKSRSSTSSMWSTSTLEDDLAGGREGPS